MSSKTCYAIADTPRAVVALLAPFAAIFSAMLILGTKKYDVLDYFRLLAAGDLSWFRQGVGWLALGFWVVRYFPPAWSALWDGPCLVSSNDGNLYLPRSQRLSLNSIRAVTLHRGFARKIAFIETTDGRFSLPLLFVRPSSDQMLLSLSPSEPTSA